jgi:hypothetical protein
VACDPNVPDAPVQLNLPGDCGRPSDATNKFLIYGQNTWCDETLCYSDRTMGGIFSWGMLRIDDPVTLYDGEQLWAGRVIGMIYNVAPQTEFACPDGATCGVLCTAVGRRPNWIVIRIAYKPATWGRQS